MDENVVLLLTEWIVMENITSQLHYINDFLLSFHRKHEFVNLIFLCRRRIAFAHRFLDSFVRASVSVSFLSVSFPVERNSYIK